MTSNQTISLWEYIDIFKRRKWVIAACVLSCLALAWMVCLLLPKSYRSSTLILVENQGIPENVVSPVVGGSVSERLSKIHQYILSRTVLSQVIDEFNLRRDEGAAKDVLIDHLRKNLKIDTKTGVRSDRVESFLLSFSDQDPALAQKVTARLAEKVLEENLRSRELLVEGTTDFLRRELADAKGSLEEQERAIAQFKKRYMGELPGQIETNLHMLNRFHNDLARVTQVIQTRTDRQAALAKMVNMYETMGLTLFESPRDAASASMDGNNQSRIVVRVPPVEGAGKQAAGGDAISQRLKELERTRAILSSEYKETYPDLIRINQEIAQIKAELARGPVPEERGEPKSEVPEKRQTGDFKGQRFPAAIIDPYLHELKREMSENEMGLVSLREQEAQLRAQVREYELRVERAPEHEMELSVLQRDYENSKANYQSLLAKQLNAHVSENLEKHQKGEKFRILDPANLPTTPESPDVIKIMAAGLALGCVVGFGGAVLLEQTYRVFRRSEEVEQLLGIPVLASVPDYKSAYSGDSPRVLESLIRKNGDSRELGGAQSLVAGRVELNSREINHKLGNINARGYSREAKNVNRAGAIRLRMELNLVSKWKPFSMVAEQFRVAATRLALSFAGKKGVVIVVTSAMVGEGKSSTASNLAYVLAKDLGKTTVLIDADMKRPMLSEYNSVPSRPGLYEAIEGALSLAECLHNMDGIPLKILPSSRGEAQPTDLRQMQKLERIVSALREQSDFIIIDAPPILALADMTLLGAMADMIVLVVRAGCTPHDAVEKAVKTLSGQCARGIILNGSDPQAVESYLKGYYYSNVSGSGLS